MAVTGLRILLKWVPLDSLIHWQDVSGTFFQVVGTLYAVLLGLIVVDASSKFEKAESTISSEANALVAIHSLAEGLSSPEKSEEIKKLTVSYLDCILTNDWPYMDSSRPNYFARRELRSLQEGIKTIAPVTENDRAIVSILLEKMIEATDLRRFRIDAARQGIPMTEWVFLLFGSIATMITAYFYRVDDARAHELGIFMTAIVMSTNLYMVQVFGEPDTGNFMASRQPLMTAKSVMDGSYFGSRDCSGEHCSGVNPASH